MKEIHIIGSGFKGLKLASILSFKRKFQLYLYTNCDCFIFTPYIVSMIYKNKFKCISVKNFCMERNIIFKKINIIDVKKDFIKTDNDLIKIKGKIIDCRNDVSRLLNPTLKGNYYQLGKDILKVIENNKKRIVKGNNIHSFEIAMSLYFKNKLLYVAADKSFYTHPLIKYIKKNENINQINNMIKQKKINNKYKKKDNSLPKNAQQACIDAKIISAKELGLIPINFNNHKRKRGTMIKISRTNSYVFLFNWGKYSINGYLGELLRSIYYFFVYNSFYQEKENKLFLFFYYIYFKLWASLFSLLNLKRK